MLDEVPLDVTMLCQNHIFLGKNGILHVTQWNKSIEIDRYWYWSFGVAFLKIHYLSGHDLGLANRISNWQNTFALISPSFQNKQTSLFSKYFEGILLCCGTIEVTYPLPWPPSPERPPLVLLELWTNCQPGHPSLNSELPQRIPRVSHPINPQRHPRPLGYLQNCLEKMWSTLSCGTLLNESMNIIAIDIN